MTKRELDQEKDKPEVKTFSVPFDLGEIKESISINTKINTNYQLSKEEIVKEAFNWNDNFMKNA